MSGRYHLRKDESHGLRRERLLHEGGCDGAIAFPGTNEPNTPWKLYNHLIAGIPEDVVVRDYCLGTHWSYVEADSGMGVSFTTTRRRASWLHGRPERDVPARGGGAF